MSLNWQNEAEHERNEFFEPVNWSRVKREKMYGAAKWKKKQIQQHTNQQR